MVLEKSIENLKDKPKDERKAIAGGIAFAILVILFFGWAFFFFKKLQSTPRAFVGGAQEEFDFTSVREARESLLQDYSDIDELRSAREQGNQYQQGVFQEGYQEGEGGQFGGSD